jgi:hypothetical protein
MPRLASNRYQFSLAGLFWLTLVAGLLLWVVSVGWWKVATVVALGTGVLFAIAYLLLLIDKLRG